MANVDFELLMAEYSAMVDTLPREATEDDVVSQLCADHAWTENGAATIVNLARMYGTEILRNALALAAAMEIEDGDAGL